MRGPEVSDRPRRAGEQEMDDDGKCYQLGLTIETGPNGGAQSDIPGLAHMQRTRRRTPDWSGSACDLYHPPNSVAARRHFKQVSLTLKGPSKGRGHTSHCQIEFGQDATRLSSQKHLLSSFFTRCAVVELAGIDEHACHRVHDGLLRDCDGYSRWKSPDKAIPYRLLPSSQATHSGVLECEG
jgi:hypothetical protein